MREFIRRSELKTETLNDKPNRSTVINEDDILNLRIALEMANDVQDLLQDKHIFDK